MPVVRCTGNPLPLTRVMAMINIATENIPCLIMATLHHRRRRRRKKADPAPQRRLSSAVWLSPLVFFISFSREVRSPCLVPAQTTASSLKTTRPRRQPPSLPHRPQPSLRQWSLHLSSLHQWSLRPLRNRWNLLPQRPLPRLNTGGLLVTFLTGGHFAVPAFVMSVLSKSAPTHPEVRPC